MRARRWGVLLLTLAPAGAALAQDNNYWTLQYGNQARLLGGAVIGSASDLSAVFYNPGRLALTDQSEFVIAGNVVEFTTTNLEAENADRSSGTTRFSLSPSLFAGELKLEGLGGGRLAYSFLTRQFSELRLDAAGSFVSPGEPLLQDATLVNLDHRLSEYWTGFTYANRVTDRIGVGVSMFVTTRSHRTSGDLQATLVSGDLASVRSLGAGYEYSHWGLLWKVGAGTNLEGWDIGFTVTTPRVKLFGSGDLSYAAIIVDETGTVPDLVNINVQTGLPTTYKSPWSIGAGGSRTFGRNTIHVGAEWFAKLGTYDVLDGEPREPQLGGGGPTDITLTQTSSSVLNFAVGFEQRRSERMRWYASVHSDYDAGADGEPDSVAFTKWNLWHLGGGASFKVNQTELTLGAIFAFGNGSTPGLFAPLLDSNMRRVTVILGFNLPFGNPVAG